MNDISTICNFLGSYVRIRERDSYCEYYGIIKSIDYNFGVELSSVISVSIHTISGNSNSTIITNKPVFNFGDRRTEKKYRIRDLMYIIEVKKEEMLTEGIENIENCIIKSQYNMVLMTLESDSKVKSLFYHLNNKILFYDIFPMLINKRNIVRSSRESKSYISLSIHSNRIEECNLIKLDHVGKIFSIKDGEIIYETTD